MDKTRVGEKGYNFATSKPIKPRKMFKRKKLQNQPESDLLEPGVALESTNHDVENEDSETDSSDSETDSSDQESKSEEVDAADQDAVFEDPEMAAFVGRLQEEMSAGKLSDESIQALQHALHYDEDLERAAVEAELKGRNEAIEERIRLFDETDGLPHPGGGDAGMSTKRRPMSIFDLARGAM
jgi:hypothetical protein